MIEVIHDAERRSSNVVHLNDLLEGADSRFRKGVLRALIQEGFETDELLPCLQHPVEIIESIRWLEMLDFGTDWKDFHQALLAAIKTGILVDISRKSPRSKRSIPDRSSQQRPEMTPAREIQEEDIPLAATV